MLKKLIAGLTLLVLMGLVLILPNPGLSSYIQIGFPVQNRSGNTLNFVTYTGSFTSGDLVKMDANSNLVDAGLTAAQNAIRTCEIAVGDPGAASPVLVNDNDTPVVCGNVTGKDLTITAVACWADAGSPTITPILTAGAGTSILTGALTCGTTSWAAGTINGTPVLHSFSANGATCSVTPCTLDANITAAGGVAKYIVVRFTRTF